MNPLGWTNFNLSPQGDGNSKVMFCSLGSVPDFNLSPQGDGNSFSLDNNIARTTFQLIPARGRKPKLRLRLARDLFISTYPRKGTETQSDSAKQTGTCYFNLSPQKPSQALRASSPEGRAFVAATYLVLSSPFRGSWHGVGRD